jgi:Uncharacterized protein conserved in bacteria (DUF2330)
VLELLLHGDELLDLVFVLDHDDRVHDGVYEKTVGAFDVTVLQGGTSQEVSDWLQTNGYASTADTPSRLKPYTDKSYVFVAVRLNGSADVDEIHPLVVKYPGTMPCIPLILTAEAALDNMGVRGFFLAHGRVFPENYADIVLNDTEINWLNQGANYNEVVSRAVDEAPAHHAFVTEYAGTSGVVSQAGIYSALWDAMPFETIDPHDVVTELTTQGLVSCPKFSACQYEHPLLLGLLHQYLPPQGGLSDSKWYKNLTTETIDMTKWDAAAFAHDFDERIVKPGQHAVDVLGKLPWLTRMFTEISPAEMTADPTFNERGDLSPQSVRAGHLATERITCDDKTVMELPGSKHQVLMPGPWPHFSSEMPFSATIGSVPAKGAAKLLVDNRVLIDTLLTKWNAEHGWPSAGSGAGGGDTSPTGPSSSGSSSNDCACDVPGDGRGAFFPIAVAIAALELARRRRASSLRG